MNTLELSRQQVATLFYWLEGQRELGDVLKSNAYLWCLISLTQTSTHFEFNSESYGDYCVIECWKQMV